jgi:hypothetical protein
MRHLVTVLFTLLLVLPAISVATAAEQILFVQEFLEHQKKGASPRSKSSAFAKSRDMLSEKES